MQYIKYYSRGLLEYVFFDNYNAFRESSVFQMRDLYCEIKTTCSFTGKSFPLSLFLATIRDIYALNSKLQSKGTREPETRCHARRAIRERLIERLSIELARKVTLNDRNFDTRISRLVHYRRYLAKGIAHVCMRVTEELNRRRTGRRDHRYCVYLRFHLYFPLSRYDDDCHVVAMLPVAVCSLRICDYSYEEIPRYLAKVLALLAVHILTLLLHPGFRCNHISTLALFVSRFYMSVIC